LFLVLREQSFGSFGFRYTFNPNMNLLAAIGHTVTHMEDTSTEVDAYLGLQLERMYCVTLPFAFSLSR
jgi:hypothetical protein